MKAVERLKWKGIGRRVLLVIILIVLLGIFVFGERGLWQWYRLNHLAETMEIENDSLQIKIGTISERTSALEALDSLELERTARHWGMIRPGEEVYVVRDENDTVDVVP